MKTRQMLAAWMTLAALAGAARADDKSAPPQITVTGEAIVYVTPDEAVITFGVVVENADLDVATKEATDRSTKLLRELRRLDIAEEQIATANLEISPRTESFERKITVTNYHVRRLYTVTLKRVPDFEKLVQSALKAGANELTGFEFRSSKLREMRDEARKMACKAAKEKAVLLATALDVTVGKPTSIREDSFQYYGGSMAQNAMRSVGSASEDSSLPTGQIPIRSNVTVSFAIE